jgi:DNA (cytosine-5)-methyltransferase 1
MSTAYYNENDPRKAAWLRELIDNGLITKGYVDERDIRDVIPEEILGYERAHFFAGIGVWDYALNLAGWGKRPVWSGSCPCQPFSAAGRRAGFTDERHLWPAWFHIISQCKPDILFGEQVESRGGKEWLDLVWDDLEALGYAFGAVVFPAAGVGAPHGRHRIYWVGCLSRGLADSESDRFDKQCRTSGSSIEARRTEYSGQSVYGCGTCGVAYSRSQQRQRRENQQGTAGQDSAERDEKSSDAQRGCPDRGSDRLGSVNGFWRDADWLFCRDGKWRPVESGLEPLAHGAPARVVRLCGYGDGLVAQAAEAFIRSFMESIPDLKRNT